MTKPMRYTHWCEATHGHDMLPTPDGEYVKWEDFERLQTELEAMKAAYDAIYSAGNEYLRRAVEPEKQP